MKQTKITKKFTERRLLLLILMLSVLMTQYPAYAANVTDQKISTESLVSFSHAAQKAWSALFDFMKEVWADAARLAPSFFDTIPKNIKEATTVARDLIDKFAPESLKRVITALVDFFAQILYFFLRIAHTIFNLIDQAFIALISP